MRTNPTTSDLGISVLGKKKKTKQKNLGRIAQIIGPVLDVTFPHPPPPGSLKNA